MSTQPDDPNPARNLASDLWEMFGAKPPAQQLSPKLTFLHKHGLTVAFDDTYDVHKWSCYRRHKYGDVTSIRGGIGTTEDECIVDWCHKNGVPHWTQEGTP